MGLLLLYVGLALGVSFLCSLLESVLLSLSHSYVQLLLSTGRRAGRILERMKRNPDRYLSSVLTLNTMAHTFGSAGAGAQAQRLWGDEAVSLFSALFTLLVLLFTEIWPKTIGVLYWKRLAPGMAYLLLALERLLYPVVWFMHGLIRRLMPRREWEANTVTREELHVLAEIGKREGVLQESEQRIIANLLSLRFIRVEDIMTPRTVVFALPANWTVREVFAHYAVLPYARIPVYEGQLDRVLGIVLRNDLQLAAARDELDRPVRSFLRPVSAVYESATVAQALEAFLKRGEHLFLVVDEFGGLEGIVTLEDALETLIGFEIVDELDTVADLRELARQKSRERWSTRMTSTTSQAK